MHGNGKRGVQLEAPHYATGESGINYHSVGANIPRQREQLPRRPIRFLAPGFRFNYLLPGVAACEMLAMRLSPWRPGGIRGNTLRVIVPASEVEVWPLFHLIADLPLLLAPPAPPPPRPPSLSPSFASGFAFGGFGHISSDTCY